MGDEKEQKQTFLGRPSLAADDLSSIRCLLSIYRAVFEAIQQQKKWLYINSYTCENDKFIS